MPSSLLLKCWALISIKYLNSKWEGYTECLPEHLFLLSPQNTWDSHFSFSWVDIDFKKLSKKKAKTQQGFFLASNVEPRDRMKFLGDISLSGCHQVPFLRTKGFMSYKIWANLKRSRKEISLHVHLFSYF